MGGGFQRRIVWLSHVQSLVKAPFHQVASLQQKSKYFNLLYQQNLDLKFAPFWLKKKPFKNKVHSER